MTWLSNEVSQPASCARPGRPRFRPRTEEATIDAVVRLPPLITWDDIYWIVFVVVFFNVLGVVIVLAIGLPSVWAGVVLFAALAVIAALIGRELRAF